MAKLIWTNEALDRLRAIGEYIAERSPEAALSVTEGVWERSQILLRFPEAGGRHWEIEDRHVRSVLYGHYRIVYEIESPIVVRVVSVVHSAMNTDRLDF